MRKNHITFKHNKPRGNNYLSIIFELRSDDSKSVFKRYKKLMCYIWKTYPKVSFEITCSTGVIFQHNKHLAYRSYVIHFLSKKDAIEFNKKFVNK